MASSLSQVCTRVGVGWHWVVPVVATSLVNVGVVICVGMGMDIGNCCCPGCLPQCLRCGWVVASFMLHLSFVRFTSQ